jgi:uncharacterized protein
MEILKIVITGAVGAGKTTFIRNISEIDVVDTDRRATDETAEIKSKTTVALDFGRLTIGPNQALHLYGTPGQARFEFMWEILIQKANAYILLVDAHRPETLRNSRRILNFMKRQTQIPMLIGVTHTDCEAAWEIDDIALTLGLVQEETMIMKVNANDKYSVLIMLLALVEKLAQSYQYS